MNARLKDLLEKRQKAVVESREILDKAENEKRDLTEEESKQHSDVHDKIDSLGESIEREKRQVELERELADVELRAKEAETAEAKGEEVPEEERQMVAFRGYLQTGRVIGDGADEFRALQVDPDDQGGYMVPPEQFVRQLLKNVDDLVHMRRLGTVIPVTQAEGLGIPTLESDPDDADWTTELATGNEDAAMAFGKRELKPTAVAKRIKVSKKLLRRSAIPVEELVRQRLAYKFGITEEKAYLTGDGVGKPLGIFTASNDGISTARDVATDNTATAFTLDGLIEAKYSLKTQHLVKSRWMFHRDGVKKAAKIKDGDGQYIWQPSKREDDPDTLLGRPVVQSEYVPNTFTTGQYVGAIGDFSNYWIADALGMEIQRLIELYAEANQIGFIGRREVDGMPVLEEAFARVKLG